MPLEIEIEIETEIETASSAQPSSSIELYRSLAEIVGDRDTVTYVIYIWTHFLQRSLLRMSTMSDYKRHT